MLNYSLLQFEVPLDEPIQPLQKLSQYQIKCSLHTFFGLIVAQLFWIGMMVTYSHQFLVTGMQFKFSLCLAALGAGAFLWATFGLFRIYFSVNTYMFILHAILQIYLYLFAEWLRQKHVFICGSSTLLILFGIYEINQYKKLQTTRILVPNYIIYGLLAYPQLKEGNFDEGLWPVFSIPLDFYCLMGLVAFFQLFRSRNSLQKILILRIKSMVFVWTIVLSICLAGSFCYTLNVPWQIFTIPTHLVFIYIFITTIKDREIIQFPKLKNIQEEYPKMFQVSDCLLIGDQDYLDHPRVSMSGGRPLTDCIVCITEESSLSYANCGHVCICMQCAPHWMEKGIRKCPICRMDSTILLKVERYNGIIFQVKKKYRIK